VTLDIEAVTRIIEEAAETLVLPRFAKLSSADIEAKATPGDPDDIVTIVDHEVETHLARALTSLMPSARVIGEEAVQRWPGQLERLASKEPLWVIDPIDGTKNFAGGETGFGIMVAWVVEGHAQAAWIVLPARRETFIAEAGSGTFLNGARIRVPQTLVQEPLRGGLRVRYMPDGLGEAVTQAIQGNFWPVTESGCAAVEYTEILRGEPDFVVYYRLLPWDHAAPALILTEAGGTVAHVAGGFYTARSPSQLTVVGRDARVAETVRAWLAPTYRNWQSGQY
jgi:fructose-1,6-bisphosphatase/inositol monophosphatase family enzyme